MTAPTLAPRLLSLDDASQPFDLMFLTTDTNKHPLSSVYGEGNYLWSGIDVLLRRIWFIVDYQLRQQVDVDEELVFSNTALLSTAEDVLGMTTKNITILSVFLMTPAADSAGGWSLDRLTGIWECADPAEPSLKVKICAKEDGRYHVDSWFGTSVDQPGDWTLLLELPVCAIGLGS